ncbi:hypothetical protein SLE2022_025480 [Rubroshorea leprosula]
MGCAPSKLDNEDAVGRYKERRRLMKEAVHARHRLAAAHADYCCSLWIMGCALSSFAAGEPLPVPEETPAVLLRPPNSHHSDFHPVPPRVPPSPSPSLDPPPPPHLSPSPSHKDLKETVGAIKEDFNKDAAAGDQVEMLERGSALSSFAAGEPLSVSDRTPAALLHAPNSHSSDFHTVPPSPSLSPHLPPPPSPHFSPSPSHKDLKEIVDEIRENFHKAAATGDLVSEVLEIGKPEFDWSFWQLKKTVYSSSVLSNLSSCWTSKLPLAMKYRPDTAASNELGGRKSLCSTLNLLWAWETKLYEEVKAREAAKTDHDKRLSALRSQEDYGGDKTKLDKSKASIERLHSLFIVNSQCVSSTSTSIIGLTDSDLVPQLEKLCHGFKDMWRSMRQYHEVQNHILQQVDLVNRFGNGDYTSELHRQATRELESAVSAWHSSFCCLIMFQRDFIRSLHGWFKLTLVPVSTNNVDDSKEPSTVLAFCDEWEWKLALDRVPGTVASEAIKSFINVVHEISVEQTRGIMKIKKRTETVSKELEKKASSLRSIERKLYNSYPVGSTSVPETGCDNGQVLDAQDPLADKKSELAACQKRMEDEILKLAKAVEDKAVEVTRVVALKNLQAGLSRVFQELLSFSVSFTEALDRVSPLFPV